MNTDHIVSSFDNALNKNESLILEMGGQVEQQLALATRALQKEDVKLSKKVVTSHNRISRIEAEINASAIQLLALRHPVAVDLRNVVMSLRIAGHLERIGQYTKNMARRTHTITKAEAFTGSVETLVRMSDLVQSMIRSTLDAYNNRDPEVAEEVRGQDESVDHMHNTLFRELLTYMMEDPRNIAGSMHLLFIAKNIERMGDHTTEIAQEIIFMVTGNWPTEKRAKSDKTSRMIFNPEDLDIRPDPKDHS